MYRDFVSNQMKTRKMKVEVSNYENLLVIYLEYEFVTVFLLLWLLAVAIIEEIFLINVHKVASKLDITIKDVRKLSYFKALGTKWDILPGPALPN